MSYDNHLALPCLLTGACIHCFPDSTNQYIRGRGDVAPVGGIYPSGLRSALVLIGAYDRHSGEPLLGVINEPFYRQDPLTHR